MKKIRKENITQKFFEFMDENKDKLSQEDQTVINIVLNGRIGFLPPKFGIWNFNSKNAVILHNNYGNKNFNIKAYEEEEILNAWYAPSVLHFVRAKPWKKRTRYTHVQFHEDWWKYAKMTDEYKNIVSYYKGVK